MIIGQLLSLVGIVALLIQTARWISKKHVARDFSFFIITVAVIASMQVFSIFRFDTQSNQLSDIEGQNRALNLQQLKLQNVTIHNQQLIRDGINQTHIAVQAAKVAVVQAQKGVNKTNMDNLLIKATLNTTTHNEEVLHQILEDIHTHLGNGTLLNASELRAFDQDVDRR